MKTWAKPKPGGGTRWILVPDEAEAEALRAILPRLRCDQRAELRDAHGFIAGRSWVTAARPHIGAAVTISMDLSEFFDSCTYAMCVQRGVPEDVAKAICWPMPERDSILALRQGLPTSPAAANICAQPLDEAVRRLLKKKFSQYRSAYTRYADDLSISLWGDPGHDCCEKIVAAVEEAARRCGFKINNKKTRIQYARRGGREIVGIIAGATAIRPNRRLRRRLRAAEHRLSLCPGSRYQQRVVRGLREACALRPPRDHAAEAAAATERACHAAAAEAAETLYHGERATVAVWRRWMQQKGIAETSLGDGLAIVSRQPQAWLDMGEVHYPSQAKKSCLRRGGEYHDGVLFWAALPGSAMCIVRGRGAELKARVLMYQTRDGRRWQGRCYGDTCDLCDAVQKRLDGLGWRRLDHVVGLDVVGHTPDWVARPYFDYGQVRTVLLRGADTDRGWVLRL